MVERGITENEVRYALEKGSKRRQDGRIVASYSYVEVVFKIIDDVYYVITVMVRW
jgi:hypothetical protein